MQLSAAHARKLDIASKNVRKDRKGFISLNAVIVMKHMNLGTTLERAPPLHRVRETRKGLPYRADQT